MKLNQNQSSMWCKVTLHPHPPACAVTYSLFTHFHLSLQGHFKSLLQRRNEDDTKVQRTWWYCARLQDSVCVFLSRNIPAMSQGPAQDHWLADSYQANELDLGLSWHFGNSPQQLSVPKLPSVLILSESEKSLCPLSAFPIARSAVFVAHADVCDSQDWRVLKL